MLYGKWRLAAMVGSVCLMAASISAGERYALSVTPERETVVADMEAAFAVNLTGRRDRPVNMRNLYLFATFPDADNVVELAQADDTTWTYAAPPPLTPGENVLRVELRRDRRDNVVQQTDRIERAESRIETLEQQIEELEADRENERRWWRRFVYDIRIAVLHMRIEVQNRIIEQAQDAIERMEEDLVAAEGTVTVLAVPQPSITAPAAGTLLRGNAEISVSPDWTRVGTVVLLLDGQPVAEAATGEAAIAFALDTTGLADGPHTINVRVSPEGFPNTYTGEAVAVTVDNAPPVIETPTPADGSLLAEAAPTIGASWSDATSGIDAASAVLTVDGADVTAAAAITEAGISFTPDEALADGLHEITLTVSDLAGNGAALGWSFTTDTTPPVLSEALPADGSYFRRTGEWHFARLEKRGGWTHRRGLDDPDILGNPGYDPRLYEVGGAGDTSWKFFGFYFVPRDKGGRRGGFVGED